jgi:thiol-disulfide isomerase/thioredoxin
MTLLAVAVAIVGLLCLLNLVLTLGVVRRLRDHSQRLTALSMPSSEIALARQGDQVAPFTATTVDGSVVSHTDLEEPTLVAFFSPDCPSCEQQLAPFAEYARAFPGGPERTLIVVTSESGGARYHRELDGLGRRVAEAELTGAVQQAFNTRGYPAFAVVVDGTVMQSAHGVGDLPQHQPA